MSGLSIDWYAYAILVSAGVMPNGIWRALGLWVGRSVDEESEFLIWVRAVATAVLAGVIAQILINPPGTLAGVPGVLRYVAVGAGFAVFLLIRRSLIAGVIGGELILIFGKWWLG